MANLRRVRPIRNLLDNWAQERFLSLLDDFDPLTARRLRYAIDKGLTLEELIALEDTGIKEIAQRLSQQIRDQDDRPIEG